MTRLLSTHVLLCLLYILEVCSIQWTPLQHYIIIQKQINTLSCKKLIKFFYYPIGLAMLLPRCTVVNMFEFIPSERMTHRCHYYHEKVDVTCTFGIWHPLAAEKLLMLAANTMQDQTVFHTGFMSIPGYRSPLCTL